MVARELMALHRKVPCGFGSSNRRSLDRDSAVLDAVIKDLKCDTWEKGRWAPNRPMVVLPRSSTFSMRLALTFGIYVLFCATCHLSIHTSETL